MTWLNPLAWIGLAAIAIPVAVHLLARFRAPRVRFPTLRFLELTQSPAVQRSRPTDLLLLAVRVGIVAAAAGALARPVWLTHARSAARSGIARAIVIDAGTDATAAATERAQSPELRSGASSVRLIEARRIADGLRAAGAWLRQSGGTREVAVLSDFRIGAMTRDDLDLLNPDIGVRLVSIDRQKEEAFDRPPLQFDKHRLSIHVVADPDVTTADWMSSRTSETAPPPLIRMAPAQRQAIEAAVAAGIAEAGVDSPWPSIEIVWPGAPERPVRAAALQTIDRAWMFDTIERLGRASVLQSIARQMTGELSAPVNRSTTIVRTAAGAPVLQAGRIDAGATPTLTLFPATPNPLLAAAIVSGLLRTSRADPGDPSAHETKTIAPEELLRWQRPAGPAVANPGSTDSDGRWLWLVALVLLGVEAWMRRDRLKTVVEEHSRVA